MKTKTRPGRDVDAEAARLYDAISIALDEVTTATGPLSTCAIFLACANVIAGCVAKGLVSGVWSADEANGEINAVADTIRGLVTSEVSSALSRK